MTETEKLLLGQLAETRAKLIVAERDLKKAEDTLESERRGYRMMLEDPDQQVRICGFKLGEYKEIVRTIAEWQRLGRPSLKDLAFADLSSTASAE